MKLKEFIPPILIKMAKKILEDGKVYESYSIAKQVCADDAYQSIELCNMIADKTIIYLEKLKEESLTLTSANAFLLLAIYQYINIFKCKHLSVLDFGGACGAHYFEVKSFLPKELSLKWYIVETPQMVKSAIEKQISNSELNFVSQIDEIKNDINFIYSSCALHYVPDPYEISKMLLNTKADYIFFNRMFFNENDKEFVTVQKSFLSSNGPGKLPKGYTDRTIKFPHTTISFPKFNSFFKKNKYDMEWIIEDSSEIYQIKKEKIVTKGILYIRK